MPGLLIKDECGGAPVNAILSLKIIITLIVLLMKVILNQAKVFPLPIASPIPV
jgi:hypothetical protein